STMSDSEDIIEVYSKLARKRLVKIKIEESTPRPTLLSHRRRLTRVEIIHRNKGGIRKHKREFSSSHSRLLKRNAAKQRWTSSVRFRVKTQEELMEECARRSTDADNEEEDEEKMEGGEEEEKERREESGETREEESGETREEE
ncbi:hypothetical protein PFISCL1PPCAC_1318, partial [Pristionchus fissidentatus]